MIGTRRPAGSAHARDLMKKVVVTIPCQMTLRGAARLLARAAVAAAPVTDDQGRCIGILSRAAVVTEPQAGPASACAWSDWQVLEGEAAPQDEVGQHVQTAAPLVAPETPVPELMRVLAKAGAPCAIVVDSRCRPLGVLAAADVFAANTTGATRRPLRTEGEEERDHEPPLSNRPGQPRHRAGARAEPVGALG